MADTDQEFRRIDDATMTLRGWVAWSRDDDGLICTSHARFDTLDEWRDYVTFETARGYRVFYPPGTLKMASVELIQRHARRLRIMRLDRTP